MENDQVALFAFRKDGVQHLATERAYAFVRMVYLFEKRLPADLGMCDVEGEALAFFEEAMQKVREHGPVYSDLWIGVPPEVLDRYALDYLDDPSHPWFITNLHQVFKFWAGVVWGDGVFEGQVR